MESIENRMMVYPILDAAIPENVKESLNGPGYREMGTGVFVPKDDAFLFALERISEGTKEEKKEFEDWYFSDNWIEED